MRDDACEKLLQSRRLCQLRRLVAIWLILMFQRFQMLTCPLWLKILIPKILTLALVQDPIPTLMTGIRRIKFFRVFEKSCVATRLLLLAENGLCSLSRRLRCGLRLRLLNAVGKIPILQTAQKLTTT